MKALSLQRVQETNVNFYRAVAKEVSPQVRFVDVAAWFCQPECVIYQEGVSIYRDSNHLSGRGAMLFTPQLVGVLGSAGGGDVVRSALSNGMKTSK